MFVFWGLCVLVSAQFLNSASHLNKDLHVCTLICQWHACAHPTQGKEQELNRTSCGRDDSGSRLFILHWSPFKQPCSQSASNNSTLCIHQFWSSWGKRKKNQHGVIHKSSRRREKQTARIQRYVHKLWVKLCDCGC